MTDPAPPPPDEVRDLTDEEYEQTYASGTGGHELPAEVLEVLEQDGPLEQTP